MAEKHQLALEGNIVGVVSITTPVKNFDRTIKDQVTWAAYRAVLRACEEDATNNDPGSQQEATDRHLGSTDASHYGRPCVVSLQDAMVTVHEGDQRVLEASVESVSVAATVPGDLCRLVLVACPQSHAFTLDADGTAIALVLTGSSLLLLGRFLDAMSGLNPKLSPRSEGTNSTPPPKPLRASQRKKSPGQSTDPQQEVLKDEPPKLTRKLSQLAMSGSNPSEENATSTAAPSCPNESGHYPLRGQLSKNRAQDCNSGYYDEVPSGPPRRVDEEAGESVQATEESLQNTDERA
ncbi:uncharacterized protein [Procambarus clarkii]|uniref:uncharacterized protein isoform X2 n=1 Tax=Procambarus clarkii TaxID=6728 RepID=UPI001E674B39|nr:uncharacterized protein LOC123765076 isoform X2 [Procambarus clarkii]